MPLVGLAQWKERALPIMRSLWDPCEVPMRDSPVDRNPHTQQIRLCSGSPCAWILFVESNRRERRVWSGPVGSRRALRGKPANQKSPVMKTDHRVLQIAGVSTWRGGPCQWQNRNCWLSKIFLRVRWIRVNESPVNESGLRRTRRRLLCQMNSFRSKDSPQHTICSHADWPPTGLLSWTVNWLGYNFIFTFFNGKFIATKKCNYIAYDALPHNSQVPHRYLTDWYLTGNSLTGYFRRTHC